MKTTKAPGGVAPVALSLFVALLLSGCADNDPQKMVESARQYMNKNDTAAAIIQLKNALQENPDLAEARFLLGQALLRNNDPVGANAEFEKARNLGYPIDKLAPLMVRSMLMLGEFKTATDAFERVEPSSPQDVAELKTLLAVAWRQQGDQNKFETSLGQALAAKSDHSPALIEQARSSAARRDFESAIATLDKVLAANPKNEEALQLKGDIVLYGMGDRSKALALYRDAVQANPKFPDAHAAIIRILLSQGDLAGATTEMEELLKLAKGAPTTVYLQALLAFQKQDYPAAREFSQQMLKFSPNSPKALEMAGSTELQLNSLDQAELHLTKALDVLPSLKVARRALVLTFLRSGQPEKALSVLPADIDTTNTDAALLNAAGQVHMVRGDLDKAEALFTRATQINPKDPAMQTSLAVSQLMSGKTDIAMESLQDIAAADQGVVADMALINAHLRKREVDKALIAIDALEKKRANDPMPSLLRGRAHLLRNDRKNARNAFEKALEISPGYMAAIAALVTLDVAEGKPEMAQSRLEAVVKRDPKNSQALIALAEVKVKNGAAKEEVLDVLRRAVEAAPADKIPRVMQVEYMLQAKDPRGALAAAQSAVAVLPDVPELVDALGRAQAANGEYNQSLSSFNKLAGLAPKSAMPHLRIAMVHAALKNSTAAQQSLRRALELQPDFLQAQRALVQLAMQEKKPADAIAVSKTVQKQRPAEGVGYLMEGDIRFSTKDWSNAIEAYRTGLKVAPGTELAIKLYTALGFSGKLAEADRSGAEWIKSHPNDVGFLLFLGDRALSVKNLPEAQRHYERVIALQPNNGLALNNLAWVAGKLGRADAISLAEKAVATAPNQPAFMDTLAMLLSEKGEHARALDLQKKVVSAQPGSPAFKLNLARIQLAAGDKAAARSLLGELEALGDRFPSQAEVTKLKQGL